MTKRNVIIVKHIFHHTNFAAFSHPLHACIIVCLHRCQTDPCVECEYRGQSHAVGDRWRSDPCQLCHCMANLTVQCSRFCPHTVTGCQQVRGNCACIAEDISDLRCGNMIQYSKIYTLKSSWFVLLFVQDHILVPGEGEQCCYCQGKLRKLFLFIYLGYINE